MFFGSKHGQPQTLNGMAADLYSTLKLELTVIHSPYGGRSQKDLAASLKSHNGLTLYRANIMVTKCQNLVNYLLTHSTERSPSWEANRFSASQEIPHILWNPEGSLPHSQVPATCPYPEPARSSPYPTSHLLKIHLNIILPSTPGSPKWFFPSGFPTKPLYTPLISPIRATCPAHLIPLDCITRNLVHTSQKTSVVVEENEEGGGKRGWWFCAWGEGMEEVQIGRSPR